MTRSTAAPAPRFEHLLAMSDARATFEHAAFSAPRVEHGYCTDDVARVLVVAMREPAPTEALLRLAAVSLRFLSDAQGADGGSRNRMNPSGRWTDEPSVDDCWGRSLWGFGTVAARASDPAVRATASSRFRRGAVRRSPALRAMVFAGLGAAEVVTVEPDHAEARVLLAAAADHVPAACARSPWPEPRLTYANAAIPEVLIAAGALLDRRDDLERGLTMLRWLLDAETADGHLSVTPVGGRAVGSTMRSFDQQPIEIAALADACARAATVDDDPCWPDAVASSVAWFLGDNDGGHVMWDELTGGGYDGLQAAGPNLNQGAESTLALLSTLQHARRPASLTR